MAEKDQRQRSGVHQFDTGFSGIRFFVIFMNGAGYLLLTGQLFQVIGLAEAGTILLLLMWAEAISTILVSSFMSANPAAPQTAPSAKALDTVLATLLLTGFISLADLFCLFTTFSATPFSALSLSVLCCLLTFLKGKVFRVNLGRSFISVLFSLRYFIIAIFVFGAPVMVDPTIRNMLVEIGASLVFLSALVCIEGLLVRQNTGLTYDRNAGLGKPLDKFIILLSRNVDLLAIPFIFQPIPAAIYVIARSFSLLIVQVTSAASSDVKEIFLDLIEKRASGKLAGMAARLNLGLFLVGGGTAVAVLGFGKFVSGSFGTHQTEFLTVLFWCVLQHSTKSIFGTYAEIMDTSASNPIAVVSNVLLILSILLSCLLVTDKLVTQYAIAIAVSHTIFAAFNAGVVARKFGIWPGPTAMFFGQIRLF